MVSAAAAGAGGTSRQSIVFPPWRPVSADGRIAAAVASVVQFGRVELASVPTVGHFAHCHCRTEPRADAGRVSRSIGYRTSHS